MLAALAAFVVVRTTLHVRRTTAERRLLLAEQAPAPAPVLAPTPALAPVLAPAARHHGPAAHPAPVLAAPRIPGQRSAASRHAVRVRASA